jgi:hypothetical protein
VSFELKEGMKPYHGKAYPIPQIHKAVLMKEIDRLCKIGVLIMATLFQVGLAYVHNTQEGWDSAYYLRF